MKNPLLIAILGIAIAGVTFGLVGPVTVILLEKINTPSWITGLATTMLYISVVLFSSIAGKLIDRYKIKRILSLGLIIVFIGSLGLIFWRNYLILFAVRFILGVGATFLFVATEVLINSCSDESNRASNISLYVVFLSIGIAAGALLIWTVRVYEWLPFVIGALFIFIVFIFESILLKEFENKKQQNETPRNFPVKLMPLIALASAALYGIFESSLTIVIPLYGLRNYFSEIQVSYFLASFVLGGIILLYVLGKLSDRKNKFNFLVSLSLILSGFLCLPGLFTDLYLLIAAFFIIGGIIPAFYTLGLTYTIERVDKNFIAQANGHYVMAYGLGTLAGPMIGSLLIELNRQYGYWIATTLLCLLFFIFFKFRRENKIAPAKMR